MVEGNEEAEKTNRAVVREMREAMKEDGDFTEYSTSSPTFEG